MIKVFTGPMFSGKSDALLNEYDKRYHKSRILLFKPKMDTRDYGVVKTRKGKEINAILVDDINDIPGYITDKINTIFIDEANFLKGNMTSEQAPFGIMPQLLSIADEIEILHASCNECNRDAIYTYYDGKKKGDILVGNDNYIALCARCLRRKKNER